MERLALLVILSVAFVSADIYFHNPRGSNNRLNENTATRKSNNRLFDSQNNNRGGYNVGDKTDKASTNENEQYNMKYFASDEGADTLLQLEATMQHGCGGDEADDPHKMNCQIVVQYMCQPQSAPAAGVIRNGQSTAQQPYAAATTAETAAQISQRHQANEKLDRGLHEGIGFYDRCTIRNRNAGLFTADQKLEAQSATNTRQNPKGQRKRSGYECPEERDYYPYWHPTPWVDLAILAGNASQCDYLVRNSYNVKSLHECVNVDANKPLLYSEFNTEAKCTQNGGTWREFHSFLEKAPQFKDADTCRRQPKLQNGQLRYEWAYPVGESAQQCLLLPAEPTCRVAPWTRSNHLGNARGDVEASRQLVRIPYFPSGRPQRCVMRIRYNISTDDYDPVATDSQQNNERSPVKQNPKVKIDPNYPELQLAINTAQVGRVFQDRSHVFQVLPRPSELRKQRIFNLNVRGKRGNIVQVYPAVEYDFIPNRLELGQQDLLHIQWTGSNTHNNKSPAGDGQAGDDGEGKGGTDRSNFLEMPNADSNFPFPLDRATLWQEVKVMWSASNHTETDDIAIQMATSGQFKSKDAVAGVTNPTLDNSPASYEGAVIRIETAGTFYYMCSRNNNFSNRSQKGRLIVK